MSRSVQSTLVLAVSALSVFVAGCYFQPYSNARLVRRSKAGGEFALEGHREMAMQHGERLMAESCGGPGTYEIIEEGETVIGTEEVSSTTKERQKRNSFEDTSTSSRNVVEWRVKFACTGVEQPPPPPAAPAEGEGAPPPQGQPQARVREFSIRF